MLQSRKLVHSTVSFVNRCNRSLTRRMATADDRPPLIPPPPPQGNLNMARVVIIGSGMALGVWICTAPPNNYDTIFDEKDNPATTLKKMLAIESTSPSSSSSS